MDIIEEIDATYKEILIISNAAWEKHNLYLKQNGKEDPTLKANLLARKPDWFYAYSSYLIMNQNKYGSDVVQIQLNEAIKQFKHKHF